MTTPSSTNLATDVVDFASIGLHELRSMRSPLLDHAVRELTAKIRRGDNTESIQEQRI